MNCEKCGTPLNGTAFCENCGHTNEQPVSTTQSSSAPVNRPENVLGGTLGALVGSAIGAASIILLSQLGFVASISGLILAFCTLKGYELLGGKLTTKGIIISLILIAIVPYLADRLDWAIVVINAAPEISFGEAFANIPFYVENGNIDSSDYTSTLITLYIFVVIGAIGTVVTAFKSKK